MATADRETALARLSEVGLTSSVGATIAARVTGDSVRELPRISVDIHTTITARPRGGPTPKVERDLEVISALGEGGMGRVLLARQHSLDREVAIKTLHANASEHEREALIVEGAITGHLEHPAIVPVHALGLDADGRPVLVMKRVEGDEWTSLVEADAPLERHLEILLQVCNAVEFAHSRRIVHRDIKPQNVLIGRYGDVYLCDWGLAVRIDRPWGAQPLCGTPGYMAPEMVLGQPVDERTDVYLLGATLHFFLTGETRNAGDDPRAATLAALDAGPYPYATSVPEELGAIANRASACEPADRYATVRALREAIAGYVQHRSSLALAHQAEDRVEELRGLAGQPDDDAQQRFERLTVEARFALDQALAQWPENPKAIAAAAALDALIAARRNRVAELERLARDLDPHAGSPQRTLAFALMAVIGVGLAIVGIVDYPTLPTPDRLFYQSLAPLGLMAMITVAMRRHAFATSFNRRLTLTGFALMGGVALGRALSVHAGTTAPPMLLRDSLHLAVVLALSGAYLFRWLVLPGLVMLGAAIACALSPPDSHLAFSLGTGASFVMVAGFSRFGSRHGR